LRPHESVGPLHRLAGFWGTDQSLSVFLGFLFVMVFLVYPLGELGFFGALVNSVAFSLLLASGVLAAWRRHVIAVSAGFIVAADLVVEVLLEMSPSLTLDCLGCVLKLASLLLLTSVVLTQTFREGPITPARVRGAIAVYLLIGLIFALGYRLSVLVAPGSFNLTSAPSNEAEMPTLVYFSFVTLTTLGYGDIIPVAPLARSFTNLEALVGQLFPAILIARLVAMELQSRHETRS
jgi:hypothetical protein